MSQFPAEAILVFKARAGPALEVKQAEQQVP
jgi:hypothetical protein